MSGVASVLASDGIRTSTSDEALAAQRRRHRRQKPAGLQLRTELRWIRVLPACLQEQNPSSTIRLSH
uniref:Uncharacterized protein n=1 Tax=Mesocestoides corti TaxID=53468 RepID=A0A5K3FMY8_MESCO